MPSPSSPRPGGDADKAKPTSAQTPSMEVQVYVAYDGKRLTIPNSPETNYGKFLAQSKVTHHEFPDGILVKIFQYKRADGEWKFEHSWRVVASEIFTYKSSIGKMAISKIVEKGKGTPKPEKSASAAKSAAPDDGNDDISSAIERTKKGDDGWDDLWTLKDDDDK